MPALIRKAVAGDVPKWIDLVKATVGQDYPDKQVYDPIWAASQFAPGAAPIPRAKDLADPPRQRVSLERTEPNSRFSHPTSLDD